MDVRSISISLALGLGVLTLVSVPARAAFSGARLSDVVVSPDRYDEQTVRLHGFLILTFEGNSLWVSEAAYQNEQYEQSIWVALDYDALTDAELARLHDEMSGRHVFVSGRFDADLGGHMGLWPGTIHVASIERDPSDSGPARSLRQPATATILALISGAIVFVLLLGLGLRNFAGTRGRP